MELEQTTEDAVQRATDLSSEEVKGVIELWSERTNGAASGEPRATLRDLAETLGISQTEAERLLRELHDRKSAEARAAEEADREQQAEIEREAMEHVRQSTIRRRELEAERLQLEEERRLIEERRKLAQAKGVTDVREQPVFERRTARTQTVIDVESDPTLAAKAVAGIGVIIILFSIIGVLTSGYDRNRDYRYYDYGAHLATGATTTSRPYSEAPNTIFYGPFKDIYTAPPRVIPRPNYDVPTKSSVSAPEHPVYPVR